MKQVWRNNSDYITQLLHIIMKTNNPKPPAQISWKNSCAHGKIIKPVNTRLEKHIKAGRCYFINYYCFYYYFEQSFLVFNYFQKAILVL